MYNEDVVNMYDVCSMLQDVPEEIIMENKIEKLYVLLQNNDVYNDFINYIQK